MTTTTNREDAEALGDTTTYQIEARVSGTATHRASAWDPHLVGQNVFATREEAEAGIGSLRALGDEWETAEYRVVEVAK